MANTRTNLTICNMALGYIAKSRITSLTDSTEEARQCNLYYDHLRQQLLTGYNWGFAKRVSALALVSDTTMLGYDYVYAYPTACLAIRFIYNSDTAETKTYEKEKYEVFTNSSGVQCIACNIADAYVEYTYDITDADLFSVLFAEALTRCIAATIAVPLCGSDGIAGTQYQLYQQALIEAKVISAQQREAEPHFPEDFITARM